MDLNNALSSCIPYELSALSYELTSCHLSLNTCLFYISYSLLPLAHGRIFLFLPYLHLGIGPAYLP